MSDNSDPLRYVLVVPALNEEESIAATLRAALATRERVCAETPVTEMNVVFVNDGSTDRTQRIVDQPEFDEVVKVRFSKNRGYGAAIKAGWLACEGELVGFVDADGTCDPAFSVDLINHLTETGADVVLAARLTPQSEMPFVRHLGNWLFARLIGVVSGQPVSDTASGFRVLRRSRLKLMAPLPNGLHFTPAMSCICLLDPRLKIAELPMPYKERIGRSKLSVLRDGIRFLYTIIFSACCYAPIKAMSMAAALLMLMVAAVIGGASLFGVSGDLAAWVILAAGIVCMMFVWTGVIVHQLNYLLIGPRRNLTRWENRLQRALNYRKLIISGLTIAGTGAAMLVALAGSRLFEPPYRLALSMLLSTVVVAGAALLLAGLVVRVIWAVQRKQNALLQDEWRVRDLAPHVPETAAPRRDAVEHILAKAALSSGSKR